MQNTYLTCAHIRTPFFKTCLLGLALLITQASFATTYHVNPSGDNTDDGMSWATAFASIQQALAVATGGDEIWVAEGTYYPTTTTDRSISFIMKPGVAIYGGFPPVGAPGMVDRDWEAHISTLSGDIGTIGLNTDNSYHVIYNYNNSLTATAILDGFTITEGNANSSSGGGMYNNNSDPTISNCTFSDNSARSGGGMYNSNSDPTISNSTFSSNSAGSYGGGMFNASSAPTISNTIFSDNSAGINAGGITNYLSPTIINNCIFYGNSAGSRGGGTFNRSSTPVITNSTFYSNSAGNNGGGMYNQNSSTAIINCILWANSSEIESSASANPTVTYSIIQGGYVGTGNKDEDPLFIDAASGDFHVPKCSPAVDAANDMETSANDFDGDPRYDANAGGAVADMGAFEYNAGDNNAGCNEPPVASCKNIEVHATEGCMGVAEAANFNSDSSDPNGDELSFSVSPEGPYPLGETMVTLTVSDGELSDECTAIIIVIDDDKPEWVSGCPDNFEIYTDQYTCLALVEQEAPEVSDICLDVVEHRVRLVHPVTLAHIGPWQGGWTAGDMSRQLPIGTYKVRWRATDFAGNRKTCNHYITVKEVLPCPYVQLEDGVGCEAGNNAWYDENTETFWLESENCYNSVSSSEDEYAFIQRELCGNGSITVKVASLESSQASNGWAGIIMRESNDPLAPSVNLATNKSANHRKNIRAIYGASVTSQQSSAFNRHWLRIVRNGNNFKGYASSNGTSWFLKFSHTVVMGSCIEIGMTLTSYTSSGDHIASFEHVDFEGNENQGLQSGHQYDMQPDGSERAFTAYPNPTSGFTNLSFNGYMDQKGTLEVVNTFGQILLIRELGYIESIRQELDLSLLPAGVYTLRFVPENGIAQMVQVVKQ